MSAHKYSMDWREVKASKPITIDLDRFADTLWDWTITIAAITFLFMLYHWVGN